MQEYRLFVFEDKRLLWPAEFQAPDDQSAIEIAQQRLTPGGQMELWERGRKIRCWGFPNCPFPQCRGPNPLDL